MKATSDAGWVSSILFFEIHDSRPIVSVIDGYIYEIYGDPITARITNRTGSKVQFAWDVIGIELSNRRLKVDAAYNASWYPAEQKLRLRVTLKGMDMLPPTGHGKCKPYKGK